jgi:hypothetical protein
MKKSIFTADERYTEEANKLAIIAAKNGIEAAFKYAEEKGFPIREAAYVIRAEVTDRETSRLM